MKFEGVGGCLQSNRKHFIAERRQKLWFCTVFKCLSARALLHGLLQCVCLLVSIISVKVGNGSAKEIREQLPPLHTL